MNRHFIAYALVAASTAGAAARAELAALGGTDGAGHTTAELVAGKPAVILLTTSRLADVGTGLQLLRYLREGIGEGVAVVGVVYGEPAAKLAKYREGMPFPVVDGKGEVSEEILGPDGKLPLVLLVGDDGDVRERQADVPDPMAAAKALGVGYDAGPGGPPATGAPLPALFMAASKPGAYNVADLAAGKPQTLFFVFAGEDEARETYLGDLQTLADDAGDLVGVVPVILNVKVAAAVKLAEAGSVDLPILAGGPLAAHKLAGDLKLPVLVQTDERGLVTGVRAEARVPTRLEVAAAEKGPAAEGEPPALTVTAVAPLTAALLTDVPAPASFDATGRLVVFSGHFAPGEADHLYEVTLAGKKLRQISYDAAPDVGPACSPDGVHVAFTSARGGGSEVWVCERLHGEFTPLTRSGGGFASPAYSPDGQWLLATRRTETAGRPRLELWLFTARGRRARALAESFGDHADGAFNAAGDGVFYASGQRGDWDIYSCTLTGGTRRRLTDAGSDDRMPTPSPNGKYVVYASRASDGPYKLWAMNADGSGKTQLTFGAGNDIYPRFNREGDALVFGSDRGGSYEIMKLKFAPEEDLDKPRPSRPLSRRTHGAAAPPSWW